MRRFAVIFTALAVLLVGCPKPEPAVEQPAAGSIEPKTIPAQLRARKAPAECTDDELKARATEDKAVDQIVRADAKAVDRESKDRWVKGWSRWSFIGGFVGIAAGLAGFFLTWRLAGSLKWAATVGGSLAGLGVLCFAFCQVLAHWYLLLWIAGIALALFLLAVIWYSVNDKLESLWDALSVLVGKGIDVDSFKDRLADAKVHTRASLSALLAKLPKG